VIGLSYENDQELLSKTEAAISGGADVVCRLRWFTVQVAFPRHLSAARMTSLEENPLQAVDLSE